MSTYDAQNAALSLFRFVSRALVQEPEMWNFILERAKERARELSVNLGTTAAGPSVAEEAVEALQLAFKDKAPTSREHLRHVAESFLGDNPARSLTRTSPKALAGQTLLSALREMPGRAAAQ